MQHMKRLLRVIGGTFATVGFVTAGVVWIATTIHFFRNDDDFLGLVSLLVPPSEIVLPWLVSTEFGVASIASTAFLVVGAFCLGNSE